jgi:hypothetical protein
MIVIGSIDNHETRCTLDSNQRTPGLCVRGKGVGTVCLESLKKDASRGL